MLPRVYLFICILQSRINQMWLHVMHVTCGRMLVDVIWYLIYFYTNVLPEYLSKFHAQGFR